MRKWRSDFDRLSVTIVKVIIASLLAILMAVILWVAYNNRNIEGTIVHKDFIPAHAVIVSKGSNTGAGDTWTIDVRPDNASRTVKRTVKESYWNKVKVGDRWSDSTNANDRV